MRSFYLPLLCILFASCDATRVFEDNVEFLDGTWKVNEPVTIDFNVPDAALPYTLYFNVRNSLSYPYARMFVRYQLTDSLGKPIANKLIANYLFDQKTGEPLGSSGLGDVFDHRFLLLDNQAFPYAGKYRMRLEQFNRQDTLQGVVAVGLRVEKKSN